MDIIKKIFDAGVVGCGGAGFPTHVKLNTEVEYFIVNGAECEPLLRTDRYIMKNESRKIIAIMSDIAKAVGNATPVIVLKETYAEEIEALERTKKELKSSVEIFKLPNFYPAGDEQVLVYEVTGRIIPPAGLPSDVGAVVSNVATVHAIYNAVQDISFTDKFLTVTGEVARPIILRAPIGASIKECIELGGVITDEFDFILGGPMMGKYFNGIEAKKQFVSKTTSGIIVLNKDSRLGSKNNISVESMLRKAKSACIQCSFCTELCPRHMLGHPLKPNLIMRRLAYCNDIEAILNDDNVKQAMICSECGVCEEYACPMGLQPRKINKILKGIYTQENIKYQKQKIEIQTNRMREYRRIPSKRIAARLGVDKYYDYKIDELVNLDVKTVCINVKQHIGAPAIPIVKENDMVKKGQIIAKCKEETLGANIHASIGGTIKSVGENIMIER